MEAVEVVVVVVVVALVAVVAGRAVVADTAASVLTAVGRPAPTVALPAVGTVLSRTGDTGNDMDEEIVRPREKLNQTFVWL